MKSHLPGESAFQIKAAGTFELCNCICVMLRIGGLTSKSILAGQKGRPRICHNLSWGHSWRFMIMSNIYHATTREHHQQSFYVVFCRQTVWYLSQIAVTFFGGLSPSCRPFAVSTEISTTPTQKLRPPANPYGQTKLKTTVSKEPGMSQRATTCKLGLGERHKHSTPRGADVNNNVTTICL